LFYLSRSGRVAEAVEHAKLALDTDPLSYYTHGILGFTYAIAGRHTEALQNCERAVQFDSESFLARWGLQTVLYFSGRFDDAVSAARKTLDMSGRHPWAMAILGLTLADMNKTVDAAAVYSELAARARREYVLPSTLALAAAGSERWDKAVCHARQAIAIRDPFRTAFSSHWPFARRLRADSRLNQILNECGID
jgi:tetratricopeptide (TPR) repeat protein